MSDEPKAISSKKRNISKKAVIIFLVLLAFVTGGVYFGFIKDSEPQETEASLKISDTYDSERLVQIKDELKVAEGSEQIFSLAREAGNLYFDLGVFDKSAELYELSANNAEQSHKLPAYYLLGKAYIGVGDIEKIISAFELAIANKTAEFEDDASRLQVEIDEKWRPRLTPVEEYNAELYESTKDDGTDGNVQ